MRREELLGITVNSLWMTLVITSLSLNPLGLNGMLYLRVWVTAFLLAYKSHLPFSFFPPSFLLNIFPRKWKLQLAWTDIPEPLDYMDIVNVFRSFLLGDDTLCSFVHILSELCSRQFSLGQGVKKRRFQERHITQEREYSFISILVSIFSQTFIIFIFNSS